MAGNFILFIICLLIARHFSKKSIEKQNLDHKKTLEKPSSSSSSASTPPSFHSPATVQTNVSPTTVLQSNSHAKLGLPPPPPSQAPTVTFNYIQNQELPPTPPSRYPLTSFPEDMSSRSSSVLPNRQRLNEDIPVIVEAVPRDNLALSEEYRTLTREDELRASIKLKESSLI